VLGHEAFGVVITPLFDHGRVVAFWACSQLTLAACWIDGAKGVVWAVDARRFVALNQDLSN